MAKTLTGRDRLKAGVPQNWTLGHKTGTNSSWKSMYAATNDVGIFDAPYSPKLEVAAFVAKSKLPNRNRAFAIA